MTVGEEEFVLEGITHLVNEIYDWLYSEFDGAYFYSHFKGNSDIGLRKKNIIFLNEMGTTVYF